MTYVDSTKLDTMISGWRLNADDAEITLAIEYAEAWIDYISDFHGNAAHSQDVLETMATKKAACELAIMKIGGHVEQSDKPIFMSICDACDRFENQKPRKAKSVTIARGAPE